MQQGSIFDELPRFEITKPIRLIELFAGYGSQALALEYLNADFEHYKICEWNYKSFHAYNDIHIRDYTDYSKDLSKENIVDYLFEKGISSDWNLPMEMEQIKRFKEPKLRKIYNDIIVTHNLANISLTKGKDLEIKDTNKYDYIMTYSFPCQDLSAAGKGAGMEKGSGTRSGLLWEVERILSELDEKPQVLLMENVPQVHSTKNMQLFSNWLNALEKMGYKSYVKDLNAKNYGIPQSRNRTFVVSILGDYNYEFPEKQKLKLKLKDMLEDKVDKKYYLSEKAIKRMGPTKVEENIYRKHCSEDLKIYDSYNHKYVDTMGTIPAGYGKVGHGCVLEEPICLNSKVDGKQPSLQDRIYDSKGISTAITTSFNPAYKIKQIGNLYPDTEKFKNKTTGRIYSPNGLSPTLNVCSGGNHTPIMGYKSEKNTTYKFRRLTPIECFRLMGVKDNDFQKLSETSNSTLYHLAGDSIVVNVLTALFGKVL